jgi:hypothetical protein
MFKCYFCNQVTPPKTTRHSVVIELREKKYSTRQRENKRSGGGRGRGGYRGREEPVQDRGGKGQEISKEVPACPACAVKQHEAKIIAAEVPAVENELDAVTEAGAGTGAGAEATAQASNETAPMEANSSE